jgi:hypothetical protein
MKPSDLFGVIVRTIGLFSVFYGAWYLIYALLYQADILSTDYPDEIKAYFASGIAFLIGGVFMMRCAEWFVSFCYPPAGNDAAGEQPDDSPPSARD